MEKRAEYREACLRYRHFAMIPSSKELRFNYLAQARIAKTNVQRIDDKLAKAEDIFSDVEKALISIVIMLGATIIGISLFLLPLSFAVGITLWTLLSIGLSCWMVRRKTPT